jgi:hypothetical protein
MTSRSNHKREGVTLILGNGMSREPMGIVVRQAIWHGPRPTRLIRNGQVIGTVGMRIPLGRLPAERRGV